LIEISERDGLVCFLVRVQPRASRDGVVGEADGALKIRLMAPPVDDRANEALRRFLAAELKIGISAVRIAGGDRNRVKRIEVRGVERGRILELLTRDV
jgi:uncharacterized protein